MRPHRDRPDTGAAAAVRDAERLVQVQMRHVTAELARLRQPDKGVEVRAVDVHLSARAMDEIAHCAHVALVDAVGGRVGEHDRRDTPVVRRQFGLQVGQLDIAVVGGGHHDDPHARQHGGGGVGAVRRLRNEADVAAGSPRTA